MLPPTTTSELELAARLRLAVTRLARRLRQHSAEGLSPSQTSALASIDRMGSLTPSELAKVERIQRPTATRVINALWDAGLITREQDSRDGRIARVRLTSAGAGVLNRGRSRKNAYLARRLERLEPDELEVLERAAGLIERLTEEIEEPER
jgi:DNA-binding MarR family transcriptional regulator